MAHRLFLDANILFSAALNPDAAINRFWDLDNAVLLVSPYVLHEAEQALSHFRPSCLPNLSLLRLGLETTDDPMTGPFAHLPEDDLPVYWAAMAGRATHLISGDKRAFGPFYGTQTLGLWVGPPALYFKESFA